MSSCRRTKDIAAFFDGALQEDTQRILGIEEHLAACPECAAYLKRLQVMREGAAAITERQGVADAQFPAFVNGIYERLEAPSPLPAKAGIGRLLALASLVAAALIISAAAFTLFSAGPAPVSATEVESISTDLEGATVDWYDSEDGTTTLQVNIAEDYVW